MYDDHYGLSGRPFQLTPDPAFWFDTATHRKAMAYLGYGLSQGEGFIVITGDPGTGKTTLVGHLMATVDPERLNVIRIVTTQIEADDLLRLVAAGLGVDHGGLTKAQLLAAIERGLHAVARSGRRTLLIIDESQSLPVASIEELRMLSNFQAGGYALLQIFLLGQPEFRARLHGSDRLEQLRQRVIAMHHLDPMGVEEVGPYIAHRLGIVGWDGRPSFSPDAIAALHRWSGGIPRRLNQLTGRVLLFGAIEGIDRFEARDVEQVIDDLDSDGLGSVVRDAAAHVPVAVPQQPAPSVPEPAVPEQVAEPATEPSPSIDEPEPALPTAPEPVAEHPAVIEEPVPDPVARPFRTPEPAMSVADPLPMTPPPPPMPPRPLHLSIVNGTPWDMPVAAPVVADDEPAGPRAVASGWYDGVSTHVDADEHGDDDGWETVQPTPHDWAEEAPAAIPATVEDSIADETPPVATAAADPALLDRIASLEARLEEQDAALRRVLTLLVDWVEGDGRRPDLSGLRAAG